MTVPVGLLLLGAVLTIIVASFTLWLDNEGHKAGTAQRGRDAEYYTRVWKLKSTGIVLTVGAVITVGFTGMIWGFHYYNERELTCTVNALDHGKDSEYRVYTSCGVFNNENTFWRGKYNSAVLQGRLDVGHTYPLRVAGAQVLGSYPNIFDVGDPIGGK